MNTMESDEQQDFERKSESRGFKPLKRRSNYVKKSELIQFLQERISALLTLESMEDDPQSRSSIRFRRDAYQTTLDFINSK